MEQPERSRRIPHHRLTYKGVIRDYKNGLLTPKGAIFYAISAMAPPGAPITINPKRFYEQLTISKSAYYDAIAALATEKRVNFVAQGDMVLWVPIEETTGIPEYIFLGELSATADSQSATADDLSATADDLSATADDLSATAENEPPKAFPRSRSSPSPTRSTRSTRSSLSHKGPTNGAERETKTLDPDFRKWLLNKARSLPQEPTLLEQWVQKQATNEANQQEFQEYQASREMAQVPPPPSPKIFEPETQQQQRLTTLQKLWDDGGRARARACKMVRENPDWGLAIGEAGFEEVPS